MTQSLTKRNIALLGGSFDPITIAHLQIATEIYNQFDDIDEVWLVPCGDSREDKKLTKGTHRVAMINLMIKDSLFTDVPIRVEDIEIKANKYIPTYDLMNLLKEKHQDCIFHFCIGADLLNGIRSWKPYGDKLVEEFDFIVMNRPGYTVEEDLYPPKSRFINTNFEGSSTTIRQRIKEFRSNTINGISNGRKKYFGINGLTTVSVIDYINKNDLYNEEKIKINQERLLRKLTDEIIKTETLKKYEMNFELVSV